MGSSFQISGKVTLDTGPATAGAKQVGSEIERLSKTGIAGFEAAQQKVIDLTKRMGELRNEILRTNDPAALTKLNVALKQTQQEHHAAKVEMRGMTLESREAAEKVQLLAGSVGVQLPAGIGNLLTKLPGVQTALGAAFNASIVFAVGAAIVSLFPKIADWIDKLRGVEDVNKELLSQGIAFNRLLNYGGKPNTLAALTDELTNVTAKLNEARDKVDAFNKSIEGGAKLQGFMGAPNLGFTIQLKPDAVKADEQTIVTLTKRYEELRLAIPKAQLEEGAEAAKIAAAAHEKAATAVKEHAAELKRLRYEAGLAAQQQLQEEYNQLLDARIKAEHDANAAIAGDAVKFRSDALKAQEDLYRQTDVVSGRRWDQEKKRIDEVQDAVRKSAKEQQEIYERTASTIESFIDRTFLTAKSLSDVFHQFLTQLLGSFVKFVSREIAAWLLGMKQVSGSGGGGGGILGSILGVLFGGTPTLAGASSGGQGGLGVAAAAAGGSIFSGFSTSLPSGFGVQPFNLGAAGGGIPNAAGGATSGALGQLAFGTASSITQGLLTSGALLGIAGGGSLLGSAFKSGSILKGAGGGALAGAGIGFLIAGPFGAIAGAIYGALIGSILGWVGKGRSKRKASELEQGFEFAAIDLLDEYKRFQVDYQSALEQMRELEIQGRNTLLGAGLGKSGRRGAAGSRYGAGGDAVAGIRAWRACIEPREWSPGCPSSGRICDA